MFYIFRRSTCKCLIIVPSVRALVVVSIKRYFLHSNSCSDREFLSKNHSKMSLFTENREIGKNREIFPKYLKFHFRCFAILEIYFLVKFRPYISVFDIVTALLILWEFDHRIDGEFHNDVIGRSRDLLIILVLLKNTRKIDF